MKSIVENNKLIAEFMGVFDKILSTGNIHSWSDAPFYYTTEDTREKVIQNIAQYSKYNYDWNWLMEVVEKIESLGYKVNNFSINNYIYIGKDDVASVIINEPNLTKKEAFYQAIVKFVNWYNENK